MFGVVSKEPITPKRLIPRSYKVIGIQEWFTIAGDVRESPRYNTLFQGRFLSDLQPEFRRLTHRAAKDDADIFHNMVNCLGFNFLAYVDTSSSWMILDMASKQVHLNGMIYRQNDQGVQFGITTFDHPVFDHLPWRKGSTKWPLLSVISTR